VLAHLAESREHEGRHVLIRGQAHFGFYPSRGDALAEGFGQVPFLVKEIRCGDDRRPVVWTML